MSEQININELGADGLPMYDENGEKYDDVKQKHLESLKCIQRDG